MLLNCFVTQKKLCHQLEHIFEAMEEANNDPSDRRDEPGGNDSYQRDNPINLSPPDDHSISDVDVELQPDQFYQPESILPRSVARNKIIFRLKNIMGQLDALYKKYPHAGKWYNPSRIWVLELGKLVEKDAEIRRSMEEKIALQSESSYLEHEIKLQEARLKGINEAKERIQRMITNNQDIIFESVNLCNPVIPEATINPPTQAQSERRTLVMDKLKQFYKVSIENLRLNIEKDEEERKRLEQANEELLRKYKELEESKQRHHKAETDALHGERIRSQKDYNNELKKYIAKNKPRVEVRSKVYSNMESVILD